MTLVPAFDLLPRGGWPQGVGPGNLPRIVPAWQRLCGGGATLLTDAAGDDTSTLGVGRDRGCSLVVDVPVVAGLVVGCAGTVVVVVDGTAVTMTVVSGAVAVVVGARSDISPPSERHQCHNAAKRAVTTTPNTYHQPIQSVGGGRGACLGLV